MGIWRVVMCIFISFMVNQPVAAHICQHGQLVVKLPDGNVTCLNCPKCPPGSGATAPCGRIMPYNTSIKCQECTAQHYSDSFSSECCKPCSKCTPDEVIVAKCTKKSDTRCSCKPCPKGYYRNQTLSKCLPCSSCFRDGMDVVVPQCVSQGMPQTQSCSYNKSRRCRSKCWYDEMTVKRHGGKHSCLPCPICSDEFGLTKPCGSFIYDDVVPKCERPTLGKTFINQQGILQSCKTCSNGEEVLVNCSAKSDTICGGCKAGFYFSDESKSCEECFWCCSHSDSQKIKNCIRDGMLFAEFYRPSFPRELFLPLQVNMQLNQKQGYLMEFLELSKSKISPLCVAVTIFLLVFMVTLYFVQHRKGCNINTVCHDVNHEKMEKDITEITETPCTSTADTREVDSESPVRHSPGHILFEKTGVEVISLDGKNSTLQHVPDGVFLQATSDRLNVPGLLENGELSLSPIIKFISRTKLDGHLEVQIPHGANMVLSGKKWKIILKELQNNKWVVVSDEDGHGIRQFVPKSNHVSFETDHLSTFAVVGYCDKHSLSVLKRMKVAAFCSETRVGQDLVVRLYCFDDCEWSFEKLMQMEQAKGGKLISSIESLDFSVTCEDDVQISIKDSDGWNLESAYPMNFSSTSLRNSFSKIPQCSLVFKATRIKGNNSFFVTILLTQSSSQTVMYASTAIKGNSTLPMDLNGIPNRNEEVHKSEVRNTSFANQGEQKDAITNCIIQL